MTDPKGAWSEEERWEFHYNNDFAVVSEEQQEDEVASGSQEDEVSVGDSLHEEEVANGSQHKVEAEEEESGLCAWQPVTI